MDPISAFFTPRGKVLVKGLIKVMEDLKPFQIKSFFLQNCLFTDTDNFL